MTRDAAHRYLVAYDISDDARRARIANHLGSFGDRVQFSVFVIDGRPAKLVRLRRSLQRLIDPGSDSVILCDLGPLAGDLDRRFEVIGVARSITDQHVLVF